MRKVIAVLLCISLFSFCLTACAEKTELISTDLSSLFPDGYQPNGWKGYKQYGSDADDGYDPSVILTTDGKFLFTFYSSERGTEELRGAYSEEESEYILTPTEGDSEEFYSGHSGEIRLKKESDTLIYFGEPNGVTKEGDVFSAVVDFNYTIDLDKIP